MSTEDPTSALSAAPAACQTRIFLVVVDETEEMTVALHYAARRARSTGGRVALMHCIEPGDFQHWAAVEDLMRQERREEAEQLLQRLARDVVDICGSPPAIYLREGDTRDELLALIAEEPTISILVLAAGTGTAGPGPLITYIVGKMSGTLRIPITIVPGSLNDLQLDLIT
ncbi:nucleotide-binding universal stress UspA family protein [Nitrospirillum amazonense]|uniref:Nucleotide-binding universal stress UspA family protein n=1 Tax=Nitrospirillum amazonense TaxID=28077 RepID=A0A560FLI6_9PROT|nr:universal stress protein [Nitrospirillum amazonense]TWB22475.1 nucleotide-binding universal stress UspA family protein [Nitrospirillum amazonense]